MHGFKPPHRASSSPSPLTLVSPGPESKRATFPTAFKLPPRDAISVCWNPVPLSLGLDTIPDCPAPIPGVWKSRPVMVMGLGVLLVLVYVYLAKEPYLVDAIGPTPNTKRVCASSVCRFNLQWLL
ncbi:hypothetical protein L211DRAFT_839412 [Terfezia boudieri ATCC MYA-4762]|uniref:Uncharacterized protein n=1 Tax=Terfezia boudieri ATCC MYA-4762 TaxID=1051890 RepID=A0A3N4LIH3_9PEZI|nr:hypothetical protein L211DRAFT_839412 [Terfezia boudieri ATCC MYA-4762]